jgi:heme/copper-type cytochrome/quinol oxidase subunit 1
MPKQTVASSCAVMYNNLVTRHGKKMIAPVIVTLCIIAYYAVLLAALVKFDIPFFIKLAAALVPVVIMILTAAVLIERIKEIRSGEEDDLSQY